MAARAHMHDRDEALARAMALFWRQGFHATSLKDLEHEIGMHPGSIYAAFQSKEMLFRLALARYSDGFAQSLQQQTTGPGPVLPRLAQFLREAHPVMNSDRPVPACFVGMSLSDIPVCGPGTAEAIAQHAADIEEIFSTIFAQALQGGELPGNADPDELAGRLQILLNGISLCALRPGKLDAARKELGNLADRIENLDPDASEALF